ncbi:hypothetical protein BJ166DRAFT_12248 [Pestalotiopsis sp. NC0098]|nr:hypothetical protein BJ166DRAFT_12248 [Pestalotiopsis sp. NC0098]
MKFNGPSRLHVASRLLFPFGLMIHVVSVGSPTPVVELQIGQHQETRCYFHPGLISCQLCYEERTLHDGWSRVAWTVPDVSHLLPLLSVSFPRRIGRYTFDFCLSCSRSRPARLHAEKSTREYLMYPGAVIMTFSVRHALYFATAFESLWRCWWTCMIIQNLKRS